MSPLRSFSRELAQALGAIGAARSAVGEPPVAAQASPGELLAWVEQGLSMARTAGLPHLSVDLNDLTRFEALLTDEPLVKDLAGLWGRAGLRRSRIELLGPDEWAASWLPGMPEALDAESAWLAKAPAPDPSEWKWDWPLDIALVSGAGGEAIIRDLAPVMKQASWMPNLVKILPVDHVSAADLLLLRAAPDVAAAAVRRLDYPRGTPLVLIQSEHPASAPEIRHALDDLGEQFPHAGIAYTAVPTRKFRPWFKTFARELTHNNPMDVSLFRANRQVGAVTPVLRASSELLQHATLARSVSNLARRAGQLGSRTMAIPPRSSAATIVGGGDVPAEEVAERLRAVPPDEGYASESALATAAVEISDAAPPPPAHRFLLARLRARRGNLTKDADTWVGNELNLLAVQVGTKRKGWLVPKAAAPFPVEEVVADEESVEAEVTCDVPGVLRRPLRQLMTIRRVGESSVCEFAIRVPGGRSTLTARVTVTYAGRIIQSGVFVGPVLPWASGRAKGRARWRLDTIVRSDLTGLSRRRRFDTPLLLETGSLRATNPSSAVSFTAPPSVNSILRFLDETLSEFAADPGSYKDGLGSEKVLDPLIKLALAGSDLREQLQDQHKGTLLSGRTIQVVSTSPDARLPIEILYDGDGPRLNARLCKHAVASLRARRLQCSCGDVTSERVLCPYRFWGVSRVIERHLEAGTGDEIDGDFALLPEATGPLPKLELFRGSVVAASERVTEHVKTGIASLQKQLGEIKAAGNSNVVTKWTQWTRTIRQTAPSLLLMLPHTEAEGPIMSLEIQGDFLPAANIQQKHIGDSKSKPVVMMLGCETDADPGEFLSIVARCRRKNAVLIVVFGATLAAEDSVPAAKELIRQLDRARRLPRPTVGEAMLTTRRALLAKGWVPALGLVAYGDADWMLV